MRTALIALSLAAASFAAPALAATQLATTVTATGGHGGKIGVLNDGVFPAVGGHFISSSTVYGGREFGSVGVAFDFDFGELVRLSEFKVSVKANDRWTFAFEDAAGAVTLATILPGEGRTGGGMETIVRQLNMTQPIRSVRASVQTTDGYYGFGEAQFFGNAGVPEPATWAMMICGFGVAGFALRCRRADEMPTASA